MAIHRIGPFDRDAGVAGADLSDKLFRAVNRAADGRIVLAAAGERPIGFVIETAVENSHVSFSRNNSTSVANGLASAAIAVNDELEVTTDGRVGVAATAGTGFGYARKAAEVDEVVEIEFK